MQRRPGKCSTSFAKKASAAGLPIRSSIAARLPARAPASTASACAYTSADTRHIGEAMNSEWIALADKQPAAAILREVAGLRFENSEFAQFTQRRGHSPDDIGVEAGG